MNVEQKIKKHIIENCSDYEAIKDLLTLDEANIDTQWDSLYEYEFEGIEPNDYPCLQDDMEGFRQSGESTNISSGTGSRHYEDELVARKLNCGTWVAWVYWTGGGKHGKPEAIDWIDRAFKIKVKSETKTVTVNTFTDPRKK